jgi:general stress protein YciG
MPIRPGNDDRNTGNGDRERQRHIESDTSRGNAASSNGQPAATRARSNRGFASMDPSKQKEIASKGGRAAHAKGTAHEFDSGEAREAGRKGGQAVSRNREHMAAIGRRGGEARGHARNRGASQTNTGSTTGEGGYQNTRTPSDRAVLLNNVGDSGVRANPQGTRGATNPIGGERRPNSGPSSAEADSASGESYGSH